MKNRTDTTEIHIAPGHEEIKPRTKLPCGCSNAPFAEPCKCVEEEGAEDADEPTPRQRDLARAAATRCEARAEAAFRDGRTDDGHGYLEQASAHREVAGSGRFQPAGVRVR